MSASPAAGAWTATAERRPISVLWLTSVLTSSIGTALGNDELRDLWIPVVGPFITIARVLRAQGRRGEVLAELHTDFPERFAERRNLSGQAPDGSRRREPVRLQGGDHRVQ